MKGTRMRMLVLAGWLLGAIPSAMAQRQSINLSEIPWNITLDRAAAWQQEKLFLPPTDVAKLPVNLPTGGWKLLDTPDKRGVTLPATVEQYLWGWNGQTFGVTGNYVGVSWFDTRVQVPEAWKGKRVVLHVGAVRFRAEIFVNRQLAGYDLVNSTPFTVDITPYIKWGQENAIAFRITDPNGNFNWKDSQVFTWGDYRTNPSHGFGGITGQVELQATDRLYISDVFVKNQPDPHAVEVEVTACNETGSSITAQKVSLTVKDHQSGRVVWHKEDVTAAWPQGEQRLNYRIRLPKAQLWSVDAPHLYDLSVSVGTDSATRRFGFRWFEVREVQGDRQFFLNGKRMVLRTAISWSFWPDNGITPSDTLARRQVEIAKRLGLNMLNFHRNIGQSRVLDYADELGLLYFEEPGGNQYPIQYFRDEDERARFYFGYRNEKLARMIRRDRSHPSLVIYNLQNERGAYPQAQDSAQMRLAHALDPTRILTYNSSNGENPKDRADARFKLHMLPCDTTFHDYGWYDRHHAGGPGCYHDFLYQGPDNYLRFSNHKDEIVYWGEEGAIGTPPRLQLICDEIRRSGHTSAWEAQDYQEWYAAYDAFLRNKGFSKAFPTVDDLTRSMGNVSFYYQGRVIENIRISNTVDAYAVNGWESMKLENHSGIVDNYRHPKGDPEVLAYYNQPLYLAVKMPRKVLAVGDTATVDTYIVNEKDARGTFSLQLTAKDEKGAVLATHAGQVRVSGGNVYGENLQTGWQFVTRTAGHIRVEAALTRSGRTVTTGRDELYAVPLNAQGVSANGCLADTTGLLAGFLRTQGLHLPAYREGTPTGDYLLVGAFEPTQWGSGMSDIMEWVYKGHTLVIVDNPEKWAEFLADKEVLDYRGAKELGKAWYGGNFFNRAHPVFAGLPSDCVFNWEYQCFAAYERRRIGLRCFNGETLVGCVSDHKKEVYSALSIIPAGRGKVIITTLDIPACIRGVAAYGKPVDLDGLNESMNTFNTKGQNRANVVGQQLLLNLLREASKND